MWRCPLAEGFEFPHRGRLYREMIREINDIACDEASKLSFVTPDLPTHLLVLAHRMSTVQLQEVMAEVTVASFEAHNVRDGLQALCFAKHVQLEVLKRVMRDYPVILSRANERLSQETSGKGSS